MQHIGCVIGIYKSFWMTFQENLKFPEKSQFYFNYKKFRVTENSKPAIDKLDQIKPKQNAKLISLLLLYNCLLNVLFDLIDFWFLWRLKERKCFSLK